MKTIILYGLRRSGNHFLISTILQQFSNYVHINDTDLSYNKYIRYKNIEKNKETIDNKWTGFKDVECVVISIENKILDSNEIDKFNGIDNCYVLMLLRCPYSHFSSVWEVYKKDERMLLSIIELWKIYSKLFINNNNNGIINVLYDKYSTDENYMINILQKLGFYNININTNKQIRYQESSFKEEGDKKQTYRDIESCIYKDDKTFLKLIEDKEINNLWGIIKTITV